MTFEWVNDDSCQKKSTPSKNMQRWAGGLLSLQVDIILSTTEQISH